MSARVVLAAVCAAALLIVAAPARAELAPIALLSTTAREQADAATLPVVSGDGRYVAFQATLGGVKGVFRRDLQTGDVVVVAGGDPYPDAKTRGADDATAPSISADGRYVSFTTTAPLRPEQDTDTVADVYVRDMSAAPGAYELASVPDGRSTAVAGGASAAPAVAMSADGRRVAFVTLASSDLAGADTPPLQVAVRDLATHRTTLVSARRDATTGAMTPRPVPGGAVAGTPGAAISGDGTTVAWLGAAIREQAPTLRDEASGADYNEPLWRRVADGPSAPTRRIIGGGDPLAPGCPPTGTLATPACQGPFLDLGKAADSSTNPGWLSPVISTADPVPHLSADGRSVVLIGNATQVTNAFLVDMHDGLTRKQAVRPLTRESQPQPRGGLASASNDAAANGGIFGVTISPDARFVALTTARQLFALAPPNLITPPPSGVGLTELYRIDMGTASLQRLTPGTGTGPSLAGDANQQSGLDGAVAPSFSADDSVLAFASRASNLVTGDANGASDAFTIVDRKVTDVPGLTSIGPTPPPLSFAAERKLTSSAVSSRDGTVALDVVVPGAGRIVVRVSAQVSVRERVTRRVRVRRGGRTRVVRRRVTVRVPRRRVVARASAAASAAGPTRVTLKLAKAYRSQPRAGRPLAAAADVTYTGGGAPALRDSLRVSFHVPVKKGRRS